VVFQPADSERTTSLRAPHLNNKKATVALFAYDSSGQTTRLDPCNAGNLETTLEIFRQPSSMHQQALPATGRDRWRRIRGYRGGVVSLRVRGLEFPRTNGAKLLLGLAERVTVGERSRRMRTTRARSGPEAPCGGGKAAISSFAIRSVAGKPGKLPGGDRCLARSGYDLWSGAGCLLVKTAAFSICLPSALHVWPLASGKRLRISIFPCRRWIIGCASVGSSTGTGLVRTVTFPAPLYEKILRDCC
jgi:hypothetical protein